MDARQIRNLIPGIDLRADLGTGTHSGRHADADLIVAKVAPLLALDSLLTHADADLTGGLHTVPRPPSGVIVNLSLPALAAAAGLRVERDLSKLPDYNYLDPHKPHPEIYLPEAAPQSPEETGTAIVASPAPGRTPHEPPPLSTGPGVRPDLYPHGLPPVALPGQFVRVPSQEASAAAVSDARDTERLAGLALTAERFAGTPAKLGSIALAAVILGALIVVSLI